MIPANCAACLFVAPLAVAACSMNPAPARVPSDMAAQRCHESAFPHGRFALVALGSGGPGGFGRAASSYLVVIDGVARILVDAGPGVFVRLGELGVDLKALDTVLLTHLHVDHAGDLPGFVKSRDLQLDGPLLFRVWGPSAGGDYPSTTQFLDLLFGAQGSFRYLQTFRNELRLTGNDLPTVADASVHEVLRDGGVHVTSIAVDHDDTPAVAYRVEHAGHSLVVSGDLASKNDNLARLAAGADVLVYDATVLDPPGSPKTLYDLHTPPRRIGEMAAAAGVKLLILSHLTPSVLRDRDAVVRSVQATFKGPVRMAEDCMPVDLDGH